MGSLSIGLGITSIVLDANGNPIPAGYVRVRPIGVSATAHVGTVAVNVSYDKVVTGVQAEARLGVVTVRNQMQVVVTGLQGVTSLGTATTNQRQNATVNVLGFVAQTARGNVTVIANPAVNTSVNVTGQQAPITLGNQSLIVRRNALVSVTGSSLTASRGTVTVSSRINMSVSVSGQSMTTGVGSVVGQLPYFAASGTVGEVTSGTTVSPALPAGNSGDLMIMTAGVIGSNVAFSGAAGWTIIAEGNMGANRAAAWYRFRQPGDAAPSVGNSGRTSTNLLTASITAYRDVRLVRNIQSVFVNSGALNANKVTVQGRNSMAVTAWMRLGANTASTPDILWTENRDNGTDSGGSARYYVDSQIVEYPAIVPESSRGGSTNNFMAVSFEAAGYTPDPSTPPNAITRSMWVRDFTTLVLNSQAVNELISSCVRDEIVNLYCSVNASFISGNAATIRSFIDTATSYGVRVWGLDGDRSYFADANGIAAMQANLDSIVNFNSGSTVTQKFYGFHMDCDPADADGYGAFHDGIASSALSVSSGGVWQSTEALDREMLMRDWVQMHRTIRTICTNASMQFGTSLPTWFNDYAGEPVTCTFDGITQNVFLHIRTTPSLFISLTSYSTDPKVVIDRAKYEILNAGSANVSTSVETHSGAGSGVSYADTAGKDTKEAVLADMQIMRDRFSYYPSFTFDNIHDWEGWKDFSPPPPEPSTPDVRQVGSLAYGARTNTTFTANQAQANDVIIVDLFVGNPSAVNDVTPPAGFVAIGTPTNMQDGQNFRGRHYLWWKRLSSAETSWTFIHGAQATGGKVYCIQLAKLTGDPYDDFSSATSNTGRITTAPAITVSTDHSLGLFTAANWDGEAGIATPSGMSTIVDVPLVYGAKQVNMSVGSTGTKVQNPNGNATVGNPWSVYYLAIPGEGGGGTATLTINGTPTTSATQNLAMASFTVSAAGGSPAYTYSVVSGSLPTGVTLNSSSGVVSGTPSVLGTFSNIVIRVTDSNLDTADLAPFTLTVVAQSTVMWPKLYNTGIPPGTTLTNYSGPMTITTPGTVIENRIFSDTLTISAANVTVRQCRFKFTGWYGILHDSGSNVLIENCEIDGRGSSSMVGLAISGGTLRYCNIYGMVLACHIWGTSTIEYNYIHDLAETSSDPDKRHFDGFALHSGTGTIIRNNAIIMPPSNGGTAGVFITTQQGNTTNIQVLNNLLMGKPSYAAYAENLNSNTMSGIVFDSNYMEKGIYGYILKSGGGNNAQDTNNVNFDTTIPAPVQAWLAAT